MITNTFKIVFQFIASLLIMWVSSVTAIPRKIKIIHRVWTSKDLTTPREKSEEILSMTCKYRLPSRIDEFQNCYFIVPLLYGACSWVAFIMTIGLSHQPTNRDFISDVWPYVGFMFGFRIAPPLNVLLTIRTAVLALRDDPYSKELVTEQALFLKGQILSFLEKDNFYELESMRADFEERYQKVIADNNPITNEKLLIAIAPFTQKSKVLPEINLVKSKREVIKNILLDDVHFPEVLAQLVLSYSDTTSIQYMNQKPKKPKSSQPKRISQNMEALSHIIAMPGEIEFEIEDEKEAEKKPLLNRRVIHL